VNLGLGEAIHDALYAESEGLAEQINGFRQTLRRSHRPHTICQALVLYCMAKYRAVRRE
jgi:hypothetical protein